LHSAAGKNAENGKKNRWKGKKQMKIYEELVARGLIA